MTTLPKRAKLTKGYIDKIAAGPKDEFHWDTDVKGFGVRVTPRGKLTFIVQGRVEGTDATPRITIGPYGVFTVDQAREQAREHLRTMRQGLDPCDLKKQDAALAVTLRTVANAYVDRPGKLKDSSRKVVTRHVTTTFADWADKPILSISEDMCKARYRKMLTEGLRGKKGAPGQANQGFSVLGALINYVGRQYRRSDGTPLVAHN